MCKYHFQVFVKNILRKELRNLYRAPDKAYASMDFTGIGAIHESDFMNSMAIKRSNLSGEELRDFFYL